MLEAASKEPRSPGSRAPPISSSPISNGAPVAPTSCSPTAVSYSSSFISSSSAAKRPTGSLGQGLCASPGAGSDARKPIDLTSTTPEPPTQTSAHPRASPHKKQSQQQQQPSPSRGFQPYRSLFTCNFYDKSSF